MPYHDHLLEQAGHLARREKTRPRQASLRRAISTAYYAIFQLLIHEATMNWKRAEQRDLLARHFEHGKMKSASERQVSECERFFKARPTDVSGQEIERMRRLHAVAKVFVGAQQLRHSADYDNAKTWSRTDAIGLVEDVDYAFQCWKNIRNERIAQAYLISLLGNPRGT